MEPSGGAGPLAWPGHMNPRKARYEGLLSCVCAQM